MSNRKRFFYNGIMLTAVALAMRTVGMVFNSFITRTVGAEGIGLYTLIMTVYSFAITFATSGINLTVTRLVASDIGENGGTGVGRIMKNALIYALIFSITASVVLFVFADYFGNLVLSDGRTVLPLRLLALSLVPIALSSLFSGYFVGVKRVSHNAAVQVLGQVFKIGITLFLVFSFVNESVEYAVLALAASTTLTEVAAFLVGLVQYLYDKRKNKKGREARSHRFSDITSMALPLALSAYIRSALLTLEHILIPTRLRQRGDTLSESLSAYGMLHGMALPLLIYPMSPLSSFAGLLVPEFAGSMARGEWSRLKRIASEALSTTLVYASVCAVFVGMFAEELGYVIYNSYGAGHYIAIMAPVIPIMYLDHVTDSMLKGIGEHVYSMWVNIADSLLSVALVWILIPVMGISGYAVVIVAMEAFNFILSAVRLYSKIRFRINLLTSLIIPLGAALLSALVCKRLFIFAGNEATGLWLFLKLLFALCIFIAAYVIISNIAKKRCA